VIEEVRAHLARFWPERRAEAFAWTLGSFHEEHPEFRVFELPPEDDEGTWLYVSAGATPLRTFDGVGHEYAIRAPEQERLMVELLATIASYSMREDHDGFHKGHTVPIGEPWIEGATADHLYFSAPWFAPPEFETLAVDDGPDAHFLWLVPITAAESAWRHEHDQEAFEQLLEREGVVPEDPARRPVV